MFEKQQQWYYDKTPMQVSDAERMFKEKEVKHIHAIFNSLSQDEQTAMWQRYREYCKALMEKGGPGGYQTHLDYL